MVTRSAIGVVLAGVLVGGLLTARGIVPRSETPPLTAQAADWYQVFFTQPRSPERSRPGHGRIDERFVEFVDSARRSLDVAVFAFDLENVAHALARAQQRGVSVRMVLESDTMREGSRYPNARRALDILYRAGIPVVGDERRGLMHHKFAVRDGEEVWTGSWNMTEGETYWLNNKAARMKSQELAAAYTAEFQNMHEQRRFGPDKPRGRPPSQIEIGDARIQPLFSPGNSVAPRIVERVSQGQAQIGFMAFVFTHDRIGQAVLERGGAGVQVIGVFEADDTESQYSEFGKMKQAGLRVYRDGNRFPMHHKVLVVDGRTVIFGSYNFTANAERDNDENCLIVDDVGLAHAFIEELQRVLAVAQNAGPDRQ